ncbi:MAG: MarC family protein [Deltaproteobacteria bacterium]|jgi:multiple antibiotic resistance protein|nr:MarC family protein [Deltaproteobacteria bacterium]MCW8892144.1 MarC family protein [Deltaproteobacteria bacterium]MCW9049031.1 MarC family protein [Deltaproteobacteria bacterium]
MWETAIVSFTTFFATIGPIDVAVMFAAMTPRASAGFRRSMAIRGTLVASLILMVFAIIGDFLLHSLGISLAALQVAGGILLLLIGIDMVFARSSGGTTTTLEETSEAVEKRDVSIFPLATPLIAGPGTMGATILLMANIKGQLLAELAVFAALGIVLLLTLSLLLIATKVQKVFGVTGMHVVSRVFGVLLTALAVQFMFDGLLQSGLIS